MIEWDITPINLVPLLREEEAILKLLVIHLCLKRSTHSLTWENVKSIPKSFTKELTFSHSCLRHKDLLYCALKFNLLHMEVGWGGC
jgi:hypothetical protein